MKQKNIEALQRQYSRYLSAKEPKKPSLTSYIAKELVSGRVLAIRKAAEICTVARNRIAEGGYISDRSLSFSELFVPPADYVKAVKNFELEARAIEIKRGAFVKMVEPMMRKAEFTGDDQAVMFSDAIEGAAREAGLK